MPVEGSQATFSITGVSADSVVQSSLALRGLMAMSAAVRVLVRGLPAPSVHSYRAALPLPFTVALNRYCVAGRLTM